MIRLFSCLFLVKGRPAAFSGGKTVALEQEALDKRLEKLNDENADGLLVFDCSSSDAEHEAAIGALRGICRQAEFPVYAAGHVLRLEDVKKLLYAGCAGAVIEDALADFEALLREASGRFGRDRLLVSTAEERLDASRLHIIREFASGILSEQSFLPWEERGEDFSFLRLQISENLPQAEALLSEKPDAWCSPAFFAPDFSLPDFKEALTKEGVEVARAVSALPWSSFKLGPDGLVPVVVQDYRTEEVLMVAYMNQEAFDATLRTGRMTYYSRSRQELWVKGLTSGHFQYVKSLNIDCDRDTILAKVRQVGAACHTGNRSCFFTSLMEKPVTDANPLKVFQSVYDVILDRKEHPKEGSYTNYLFEKGIDKILKKVGEECTEIVIAAKNPDPEEIKYEISDFLYHVMVLMAEKGVTWEDVTAELANR